MRLASIGSKICGTAVNARAIVDEFEAELRGVQVSYQLSELQEKWLQALESGEYEQTRGRLFHKGSFCCLGLACKVMGMSNASVSATGRHNDQNLSEPLAEVLGLRSESGRVRNPIMIGDYGHYSLVSANDSGATFAEIAAAIRANPENFFRPNEDKGGER